MSNLKFRAWDIENKKMIFWGDGKNAICTWDSNDFRDIFFNQAYFELMQFTGLKDKNGKEIYEGDIVKSEYDKTINWEVYWDKERFWLRNIPHSRELGDMNACDDAEWTIRANKLEVIGNIYENPELLKQGGLKNGNSSNSS